jgi:amino acid adenylation domain-containing protein
MPFDHLPEAYSILNCILLQKTEYIQNYYIRRMQMRDIKKSEDKVIVASQLIKEKKYWLEKLEGELGESGFPYDFEAGAVLEPVIDSLIFEFQGEVFSRLIKLSNGSDSRLHMILTACVVVLLYRYSGSNNIIVGIPVDKQDEEGDFINTVLAVKNHLGEKMIYKELLLQVRETIIEAIENQNYPIEVLLHDLGMNSSEGRFPLFDVAIILENIQDKKYLQHVNTAVNFIFKAGSKSIETAVEYNSLLYKRTTIERIVDHFTRIMGGVLSNVNVPIADIELLSEKEKECILVGFNNTLVDYPENKTIHRLFEEQVEINPGKTALVYEKKSLTYEELSERVTQLARVLRAKGVQPTVTAGICVTRSIEMVVGLLGILKAGGAYLPIDPWYPLERIQYIIEDSAIDILLTNGGSAQDVQFPGEVINLDHSTSYNNDRLSFISSDTTGNHPAYIIYTSGSTGKPKGVIIEHSAIVNTLYWKRDYCGFSRKDAILQIPSFSFDSSVTDIFAPLISGSTLVLINYQYQFEMDYLSHLIRQNQVTHFLIVPTFYKTFLEQIPDDLENLTAVTVAGDHFTEHLVKDHFEKLTKVKLYNEYGPTENSVCSTVYEFEPGKPTILIGKPISNVKCYILDENGRISPIGVPGELCVSGKGIARGYLNKIELTMEKFVIHPDIPGKRIYKTGDLAKWVEDGNLEFLGRMDYQVKIRGYRIELGEIEKHLLKHGNIDEVVVMSKEDKRGEKYLCAYFISAEELNPAALREFLMDNLPEYMVPTYYVQLEQMPLTSVGKIDRKQLGKVDIAEKLTIDYVGPRTELEKSLAEIWQNELGVEEVGIRDNYFNIGGDSIKSIALLNIVNEKIGINLKVADLYLNNTIEKLAIKITEEKGEEEITSTDEYDETLQEVEELQKRILEGDR